MYFAPLLQYGSTLESSSGRKERNAFIINCYNTSIFYDTPHPWISIFRTFDLSSRRNETPTRRYDRSSSTTIAAKCELL